MPPQEIAQHITRRITAFCYALRAGGIDVTPGDIVSLFQAVDRTDSLTEPDFYLVARTVLVKKATDYANYDAIFNRFWHGGGANAHQPPHPPAQPVPAHPSTLESGKVGQPGAEVGRPEPVATIVIYSPLETKRFRRFDDAPTSDWRRQRRVLRVLHRYFASQPGRRFHHAHRGRLDAKRTIRSNLMHGGELLDIIRQRRRLMRTRLLVMCDVSGSMDGHTTSLLLTLGNLCRLQTATEVFAFSTHLVRLTDYFRYLSRETALKMLSEKLDLWGSGTRIGQCLSLFNARFASLVDERTVVLMISDGWDVGDTELLRAELAKLRRRCRALLWLNPLAEKADFEPATAGMMAAHDYIDILCTPQILSDIGVLRRYLGTGIAMPQFPVAPPRVEARRSRNHIGWS